MGVTVGPTGDATGYATGCRSAVEGLVEAGDKVGDEALLDASRVQVEHKHRVGAYDRLHVRQAQDDGTGPGDDGWDLARHGHTQQGYTDRTQGESRLTTRTKSVCLTAFTWARLMAIAGHRTPMAEIWHTRGTPDKGTPRANQRKVPQRRINQAHARGTPGKGTPVGHQPGVDYRHKRGIQDEDENEVLGYDRLHVRHEKKEERFRLWG